MSSQNSRNRATQNYVKRNYERVIVQVRAGAKEELMEKAKQAGVSLNRYVLEAVENRSGLSLTLDNTLPWIEG